MLLRFRVRGFFIENFWAQILTAFIVGYVAAAAEVIKRIFEGRTRKMAEKVSEVITWGYLKYYFLELVVDGVFYGMIEFRYMGHADIAEAWWSRRVNAVVMGLMGYGMVRYLRWMNG